MKKSIYIALFSAALFLSFMGYGQSFDMVIKIDGIPGESTLSGHAGEINVLSYSDGIASCAPNSSTKTVCKAIASSLNFMTSMDKSTIPLRLAVASAKLIPTADMTLIRRTTSGALEFYRVHMENVTVITVQESGSTGGDSRPTVSVSLSYARVAWEYTEQSSTGGAGDKVTGGWDFVLAKPFAYTFQ